MNEVDRGYWWALMLLTIILFVSGFWFGKTSVDPEVFPTYCFEQNGMDVCFTNRADMREAMGL